MRDIIIIGGGPAGISAAINAKIRSKDVLVISNGYEFSGLSKAERVDNYPGLPGISGDGLISAFYKHMEKLEIEVINKRVLTAMPTGNKFFVSFDNEVQGSRILIIASGSVPNGKYPGEAALLGKGVSYCATCDGMLYRGRRVLVTGSAPDTVDEANYLAEIGCEVTFFADKQPERLSESIRFVSGKKLEVLGEQRVEGVMTDSGEIACDGVFILRPAIAPQDFLTELETENGFIKVDRYYRTNIDGVFAAGDCIGRPLQIAKAVGEGQAAVYHAIEYLNGQK